MDGGAGADDAEAGVGEGADGATAVWGRDRTGDGRAEWTQRRGGTERAWQRTGWVVWIWAGRVRGGGVGACPVVEVGGARRVWEAGRASIGGGHGDTGKDGCGVGARAGTRGDVARAPAEWVARGIRARKSENGARGGKPRTSFADGAEGKRIPQGGSGQRREAVSKLRPWAACCAGELNADSKFRTLGNIPKRKSCLPHPRRMNIGMSCGRVRAERDTSEVIGERAVCECTACCIFSERLTEDGRRPSNWAARG
jgi:hypothetical protein